MLTFLIKELLFENSSTQRISAFGADSIDELCLKFEALLAIAVRHGLKFKESKCVLGTRAICHLGFIVNSEGIHIDPRRIDRLLRMSAAKDVDDIRHILGAFGFCRAWLADSASITAPLTDLLKKDCPFAWGPKQQRALDRLKSAIIVAPCLAGAINPRYPVYGRTDASILGVAAVLFQFLPSGKKDADGNDILLPKAIAFASRRFSPTEFRWTVIDREHSSLKFFFEKFGDLVYGYDIRLQTGHRNSLCMSTSASPKVIRWRLFMNRWSFALSHIPGKENEKTGDYHAHTAAYEISGQSQQKCLRIQPLERRTFAFRNCEARHSHSS